MCQKVKNFLVGDYKERPNRFILRWWVITVILMVVLITIFGGWSSLYYYPEATYQHLEKEANRIIDEHDLNSKYELEITSFSNKTNRLDFVLKTKDENGDVAKIVVEVKNYQQTNQKNTINRDYKSASKLAFVKTFYFICISVVIALLIRLVVEFTLSIKATIKQNN